MSNVSPVKRSFWWTWELRKQSKQGILDRNDNVFLIKLSTEPINEQRCQTLNTDEWTMLCHWLKSVNTEQYYLFHFEKIPLILMVRLERASLLFVFNFVRCKPSFVYFMILSYYGRGILIFFSIYLVEVQKQATSTCKSAAQQLLHIANVELLFIALQKT